MASRRPASPTPQDQSSAFLSSLGANFLVAGAPSSDDHSNSMTAAPSYRSAGPTLAAPGVHPSDIYGRPTAPDDVSFHFGEDDVSTIAPGDSVSQVGRRLTSKKLGGPRPMESAAPPPLPIQEEVEPVYQMYRAPNIQEDDKLTIIAPVHANRGHSPASITREYVADEEEDETNFERRHGLNKSSASTPLVPSAAPFAGSQAAVQRNDAQPNKGYAAVDRHEEEEEALAPYLAYAAYSRAGEADLEQAMKSEYDTKRSVNPTESESNTLWSNPISYVKSFRSANSSYAGSQFELNSFTPQTIQQKGFHEFDSKNSYNAVHAPDNDVPKLAYWRRALYDTTPNDVRIQERQDGLGIQKRPWASYLLVLVYSIVLAVEFIRMAQFTGSPIQTKPNFNPMVGPSPQVLINSGARFAGCTKYVTGVTDIDWICLMDSNSASVLSTEPLCSMSDICGFGGFASPQEANQTFRFVLPIFLHAGIIHLLLNAVAQIWSAGLVEIRMGTPKFLILYFACGIFGFILGSNFALVGQPSVGASGAIFGTHAAILVDLLAHWKIEPKRIKTLIFLLIEILIGFGLGWVPGIDNFSHLGGFVIGLLAAIVLLPVIHTTKRHQIIFWILRPIAAALIVILFVVLTRNFYQGDPFSACEYCRYLSCWPTASNNHCKGTGLSTITQITASWPTLVSILFSTWILPWL